MCTDSFCPMKELCYRYTAPVNPDYQMYFYNSPLEYTEENDVKVPKCNYFWDNTKTTANEHSV